MSSRIKRGLAFHCHHDRLWEYVYDFDERVRYIKNDKPKWEQALRLRLFKLIPDDMIPGRDSALYRARDKAEVACAKAAAACDKADAACDKATVACYEAQAACDKAWAAYAKAYGHELESLHEKLCPECPWDGKTIFPKEREL